MSEPTVDEIMERDRQLEQAYRDRDALLGGRVSESSTARRAWLDHRTRHFPVLVAEIERLREALEMHETEYWEPLPGCDCKDCKTASALHGQVKEMDC